MAKKAKITKTIRVDKKTDLKKMLDKLEDFLEIYFVNKAPKLPVGLKKFIIAVWPYLILLGLIINLPFLVSGFDYHFIFLRLVRFVIFVLYAMALPNIFKKKVDGWRLVYYTVLINSLVVLFTQNIFNFIIGTAISFYFIFQIKEFYSK